MTTTASSVTAPTFVGDRAGSLISARGLNKIYPTASGETVEALVDVDFDIADGEFISIVGPSGCGKSTLMKIMSGLLSYSSGEISIGDRPVYGPSPDVGLVFQAPTLLPWRTILQNVCFPVEIQKGARGVDFDRARSLMAMVGLAGFENRYPHELSGGMQQRAAIVRALVQNPRLLLMDEPFGALDAMTREQMNVELLRIWQESRKTIVFITHSIPESVFLSDRVIAMTPRPGRIAEIIRIDLPRPRGLAIINTPEFGAYTQHLRTLLNASEDIAG